MSCQLKLRGATESQLVCGCSAGFDLGTSISTGCDLSGPFMIIKPITGFDLVTTAPSSALKLPSDPEFGLYFIEESFTETNSGHDHKLGCGELQELSGASLW